MNQFAARDERQCFSFVHHRRLTKRQVTFVHWHLAFHPKQRFVLEENYGIQVQDEDIVPENFSSLNKISSFIGERHKPA